MQLTIADVLQLVTTGIAVVAIYLAIRKQPSEIKATEANTAGDYIDNQNKLLAMFTAESLSKIELLNRFGALNQRVIDLEQQVVAVTRRAEAGEQSALDYKRLYEAVLVEVDSLKKQVRDYPQTVIDLQTEVARLRELASLNATARITEAETASTLAHAAAASAPPTALSAPKQEP